MAQADVAWPERGIVFFPSMETAGDENVAEFKRCGWTIITELTDNLAAVFAAAEHGKES